MPIEAEKVEEKKDQPRTGKSALESSDFEIVRWASKENYFL